MLAICNSISTTPDLCEASLATFSKRKALILPVFSVFNRALYTRILQVDAVEDGSCYIYIYVINAYINIYIYTDIIYCLVRLQRLSTLQSSSSASTFSDIQNCFVTQKISNYKTSFWKSNTGIGTLRILIWISKTWMSKIWR